MESVRVLLVDDFSGWLRAVTSILQRSPELRIVGTAADGLAAVRLAEDLQPDLIVLDIGLPILNGLEAARRIVHKVPGSKVIFLSQNSSPGVIEEAFHSGGCGFVAKADAATDLLDAISTVLVGNTFIGRRFSKLDLSTDL